MLPAFRLLSRVAVEGTLASVTTATQPSTPALHDLPAKCYRFTYSLKVESNQVGCYMSIILAPGK